MVTDERFVTTGGQHLKRFYGMISRALATGHAKDLVPRKVDADELIRAYRGEAPKLSDEERERVRRMYEQGSVTIKELAELFGVCWNTMGSIINPAYKKRTEETT